MVSNDGLAGHPSKQRRPRLRRSRLRIALISALLLSFLLVIYALFVEPYWIEVSRHTVKADKSVTLKIAHLSDLHTRGLGRRERSTLAILESERPDVIVITGDTTADTGTLDMTSELLRSLQAPLGVWAVRGNWEIWRPSEQEREVFESAGIRLLVNANAQVKEGVWFAGFDDAYAGSPDLETALRGIPSDAFTVALFHTPEYFISVAGRCDLALAGHMHGGQVRIPVIGPLWLPARNREYLAGWFERGSSRMYVSRGVGTSIMNVRFNCRPEVAMIEVTR